MVWLPWHQDFLMRFCCIKNKGAIDTSNGAQKAVAIVVIYEWLAGHMMNCSVLANGVNLSVHQNKCLIG